MPTRGVRSPIAPPCPRDCATPTTASGSPVTCLLRLPTPTPGDKLTREAAMARGQRSVLREGVIAGVIGAVVVATWFLVFDIARGRPFLTPALLGAAVFHGVRTPEGVPIAFGAILGYTILHVFAFVAFGVVAASVIAVSE